MKTSNERLEQLSTEDDLYNFAPSADELNGIAKELLALRISHLELKHAVMDEAAKLARGDCMAPMRQLLKDDPGRVITRKRVFDYFERCEERMRIVSAALVQAVRKPVDGGKDA